MLAFHGDPAIKQMYLARVEAHYLADEIIHGKYWEDGKGCAIGCTIEGYQHSRYERELGIPRMIARLEDVIFEGLENGGAKEFPLEFLQAIPVGADLSLVVPRFFVWLLVDETDGVIRFATGKGPKAIRTVAGLYRRIVNGGQVRNSEWRNAADTAAADAAYTAAAAAVYAAYAAAYAAADAAAVYAAAADAADAAAAAAADAAARNQAFGKMKIKLLELLRVAPVPANV